MEGALKFKSRWSLKMILGSQSLSTPFLTPEPGTNKTE